MKNKEIIREVSEILGVSGTELAIEQKGRKILVRRYNDELNGMIVAEYSITKDTLKIK